MRADVVKRIARDCGFELAGIARAGPPADFDRYQEWLARGAAGEMRYLTDDRAAMRRDPRNLLPAARSVICVGKLYNRPTPALPSGHAGISRYAWGEDYHGVMRAGLERVVEGLRAHETFEWKICVDTAPLLERSFARLAGLGWIGRNTCLINEPLGSWFFLGEIVTSLDLEPDSPPPDRCGTCRRCIDACPTGALTPAGSHWALDSRRCISYLTIELRGDIPAAQRAGIGTHVFGCDICQDVCPWNSDAPLTETFSAEQFAPPLEDLAKLSGDEFRLIFKTSPLARPKHTGFLRNVAVAMGNSGLQKFREPLAMLAGHSDPTVAGHARWALEQLDHSGSVSASDSPDPA